MLFIIVIISIFVTAWIGIKFFYFVPQKACGSVLIEVLRHSARNAWACIGGGKKRWQGVCGFASWIGRQRLIGIVLVVALTSVSATLAMSRRYWLDRPNAQEIRFTSNARLALSEEKLAPPSTLPPSIFIGYERLALESADRDWGKFQPVFRQSLLLLLARMQRHGYQFVLLEGYRSPERQDALAAMGSRLTQARAFESRHQFGLAADLAPIRNGALAFDFDDPWTQSAYLVLGKEAHDLGMIWGGLWKLQDYGHVELGR